MIARMVKRVSIALLIVLATAAIGRVAFFTIVQHRIESRLLPGGTNLFPMRSCTR
jgi:hypothetical protein